MKVILTRSLEESKESENLFLENKLNTFTFPCIEYTEPSDNYKSLDDCIRRNHEYDWVLFLSKKAGDVFFTRILELGGQFFHVANHLKIACIGEKTAEFIRREVGFPVDFSPKVFNSDNFIKEFQEEILLDKLPNINRLRFLIPREENISDDLKENFEASGQIEIELSPAYQIKVPQIDREKLIELKKLLTNEKEIYITLASSNTAMNFFELTKEINWDHYPNIKFISIGPKTTESIKRLFPSLYQRNLVIESKQASFESMISLIAN